MVVPRTISAGISRTLQAPEAALVIHPLVVPAAVLLGTVVAAAAAGITRVMLPARNRRDWDDIPQEVRDRLEFVWLEKVEDAVAAGLQAG